MSLFIKSLDSPLYVQKDLYRHAANILLKRWQTSLASGSLCGMTPSDAADTGLATNCDWMSESVVFEEWEIVIGGEVNNR